jgi:hypothetical protein
VSFVSEIECKDTTIISICDKNKQKNISFCNMILDKTLILRRFKDAKNIKKDLDLASHLGINQSTLANWKHRNSIDFDILFSFCDNISLDWLIFGIGEMFRKNEEKPPENIQISNRQCRSVQNNFGKNSTSEPPAEYGNTQLTIQSLHNTIEAQQRTIEAQQHTINTQQELIDLLKKQLSE